MSAQAKRERHTAYMRDWRKKNPESYLASQRKYRQKTRYPAISKAIYAARYPEKMRARRVVDNALKYGTLIRPNVCGGCGKECKPQAHHQDYAKPLEIMWLCRPCHLAVDGKQPRTLALGDPQRAA